MNTQTMVREPLTAVKPPDPRLPATLDPRQGDFLVMPPQRSEAPAYPLKLTKAIAAIMRDVGPVAKAGRNTFHNYNYPKSDDVVDLVYPLLGKHGLIITQSEVNKTLFESERTLAITYEYTIVNEDGDIWPDRPVRTGLAWVKDSKGTVDDKAANKCSTQSEKYFYIKFFKIRTSDAHDTDTDGDPRGQARQQPKPPDPTAKPAPAAPAAARPQTLSITSMTTFESFAADYLNAATSATTPEEVKEWERLNEVSLEKLATRAPDVFADLVDKVSAHASRLVRAAKPATPKPPNPNAAPKPPNPSGEDIPRELLRDAALLKGRLLGLIWNATEGDLDALAKDKAFYEQMGRLDQAGRDEINLAFMQRREDLFAKK